MATLAANNPTLLDWMQALDTDGSIATTIELLHETNEILADWTFMEGNLVTGHKSVVRTGLPDVTWRRLYGRVQPDKAERESITDTCGMLEAYNEVDVALADLGGNTMAFRLQEARAQIESFAQEAANTLFNGSTEIYSERFDGLAPRFNDLSAGNAENIIDAGGLGSDNASIWLVVWGPNSVHGIVPKGSNAGLQVKDKGQVTSETSGGLMEVYRMHFRWDMGLTVKDWRYIVRIANIDRSELTSDAATGANIPELMFQAIEQIPNLSSGRARFYMDRTTRTKWRQQMALLTKNSTLTMQDVGGHRAYDFEGIPVRRADALAVDEARIT